MSDTDDAFTVPLDEFCQDLSRNTTAVELIAVFRFRELQAKRMHDKPAAYQARYAATAEAPTHGNTRPASQ